MRHDPRRKVGLVEDLPGVQRRERNLRCGNCPQSVTLQSEGVVGELGEMARGRERGGGHQRGRAHFFERVGIAIEGELAQRAGHRGAKPALHREHRAADLGGSLVVENAQCRTSVPMRNALVIGEGGRQVHRPLDDGIVVFALAVGSKNMGEVGDVQHHLTKCLRLLVTVGRESTLTLAEFATGHHGRFGGSCVARLAQGPHLLADLVDLRAQVVALEGNVTNSLIKVCRAIELFE